MRWNKFLLLHGHTQIHSVSMSFDYFLLLCKSVAICYTCASQLDGAYKNHTQLLYFDDDSSILYPKSVPHTCLHSTGRFLSSCAISASGMFIKSKSLREWIMACEQRLYLNWSSKTSVDCVLKNCTQKIMTSTQYIFTTDTSCVLIKWVWLFESKRSFPSLRIPRIFWSKASREGYIGLQSWCKMNKDKLQAANPYSTWGETGLLENVLQLGESTKI